jgi:hypothetical protein
VRLTCRIAPTSATDLEGPINLVCRIFCIQCASSQFVIADSERALVPAKVNPSAAAGESTTVRESDGGSDGKPKQKETENNGSAQSGMSPHLCLMNFVSNCTCRF